MHRFVIVCLILLSGNVISISFADPGREGRVRLDMKITFDAGTLIEHTLTATCGQHTICAIYQQRRSGEGSNQIAHAGLSYRPHASNATPLSHETQQMILAAIINLLESKFQNNLKLTYFISSGFLNAKAPIHQNFLAFQHYTPWTDYLNSATPHLIPQHKTHAMVVARWKEKGVYTDIIEHFYGLGYELKLEGFEKLFVQRADAFAGDAQLRPAGIKPQERFPYPGSIQFSIHEKKGAPVSLK